VRFRSRERPAGTADTAATPGDRRSAAATPPAVVVALRRAEADRPDAAPSDAHPVGGAAPERRTSPAPTAPEPQIPGVPAEEPVGGPDVAFAGKAEGPSAPKISATVSPSASSANPVVPLVAVNRSVALSPGDVPPATPVAPPAVPEQIVSAVVPLHGRGDGRHEVTLELRPDHLGTIRVEVSVEHQTVHLTIHAADPATSRLLAANLPELRTAFADAGLTAGHLGVGADSGHGAGHWRNPSGAAETDRRPTAAGLSGAATSQDVDPVRLVHPAATGRLDLLL